jgi:hypothetical protein
MVPYLFHASPVLRQGSNKATSAHPKCQFCCTFPPPIRGQCLPLRLLAQRALALHAEPLQIVMQARAQVRVPWRVLWTVPLILGAAAGISVVIFHFVHRDARVSADSEFERRFAGSLDLFGEFFSSRQRVLRGLADAICADGATPSVPQWAQVRPKDEHAWDAVRCPSPVSRVKAPRVWVPRAALRCVAGPTSPAPPGPLRRLLF